MSPKPDNRVVCTLSDFSRKTSYYNQESTSATPVTPLGTESEGFHPDNLRIVFIELEVSRDPILLYTYPVPLLSLPQKFIGTLNLLYV